MGCETQVQTKPCYTAVKRLKLYGDIDLPESKQVQMFTAQYTEGDHAIIDFKDHTWRVYREQHQHQAQLYPRAGFSYQIDLYSLLSGCAQYQLNKLQKVQNNLVLRVPKTDHIFPHLVSLHWLPIDSWIQYKLASLYYNCLVLNASVCLTELLTVYKPTHQLRSSSDTSILCLTSVCTHSLGQRSFSYAASYVWNSLPFQIRSSNTFLNHL